MLLNYKLNEILSKLNKIIEILFERSEKVFAFGKFRLCLVGLRLHFPSENRQIRFYHPLVTSHY